MIAPGTKKGEIFFGPLSFRIIALSSMLPSPPIPGNCDPNNKKIIEQDAQRYWKLQTKIFL